SASTRSPGATPSGTPTTCADSARSRQRNPRPETRPRAILKRHDITTDGPRKTAGERETQARPLVVGRRPGAAAGAGLEYPVGLAGGEAGTVVFDQEFDRVAVRANAHLHPALPVTTAVLDQWDEDARRRVHIHVHPEAFLPGLELEVHAGVLRNGLAG